MGVGSHVGGQLLLLKGNTDSDLAIGLLNGCRLVGFPQRLIELQVGIEVQKIKKMVIGLFHGSCFYLISINSRYSYQFSKISIILATRKMDETEFIVVSASFLFIFCLEGLVGWAGGRLAWCGERVETRVVAWDDVVREANVFKFFLIFL